MISSPALREQILAECFGPYTKTFAAGQAANNKLDLERIGGNSDLKAEVVAVLGDLALPYEPEFVVGVPDGAKPLGDAVAAEIGCYAVHLKREGDDAMDYEDEFIDWQETTRHLGRGVLVEDVFNRFTNTRRALAVPGMASRIKGVVAIWDRGFGLADRGDLPCPHQALIEEYIPEILPPDHELWDYALNEAH